MKCGQARRLFGAFWDDEITQAEREWLEAHFLTCSPCRTEYDAFSRVTEAVSTLPRVEPAPDLVERTLARARRTVAVQDVLPAQGTAWIPATAAAVVLVLAAGLLIQWVGTGSAPREIASSTTTVSPGGDPAGGTSTGATGESDAFATAVPDSIFDPNDDIEFVLDAVTLRRGRATVERSPQSIHAEQAVISF